MSEKKHKLKQKIGKPPGTMIYTGSRLSNDILVTVTEFDENNYNKVKAESLEELKKYADGLTDNKVVWINVSGISNIDEINKIGNIFNIHPLVLEDIVNVYHRPKTDFFQDEIFTVLKKISIDEHRRVQLDQISILLKRNCFITFVDSPNEEFKEIHQRLESGKGFIRKSGLDYLFYVMIDYVVDQYFLVAEDMSDRLECLEDSLIDESTKEDLAELQRIKKDLQKTKQSLYPIREILNSIIRRESELVKENILVYLRDTLDHHIQLIETFETYRDSVTTLMDIYLSSISNKLNEVMKVLTIISTIFIPLSFIAGLYGMNFRNMPELTWKYGYPAVISVMVIISGLLVLYFKRKKWF